MQHEPSLFPNFTLFIQMGIFFASWAVLHFLVFRPYVALIEKRHEKTEGLKEKAEQDRLAAEEAKLKYEIFMKDRRKEISALVEEERQKTSAEERKIIEKAREETLETLKKSKAALEADYQKARKELFHQLGDYSSEIAGKVLGRKVEPSSLTSSIGKENSPGALDSMVGG